MKRPKPMLTVEVHFTPRECEYIFLRFEDELSFPEIAEKMGITVRSVKWYSHKLCQKLNLEMLKGASAMSSIKIMRILLKNKVVDL